MAFITAQLIEDSMKHYFVHGTDGTQGILLPGLALV